MRADVTIYDITNDRLAELDMFFSAARSRPPMPRATRSPSAVEEAELVIGAVLVPGAAAPKLVTREMLKTMKRGSVLVDIAIDQGGCFETIHATTHDDPVYEVDGVIHYCVANMPGAVARTSAFALNNATLPFALKLANLGAEAAMAAGSAPRQRPQRVGRQDPPPGRRRGARPALRTGLRLLGAAVASSSAAASILDQRAPAGIGRRVGEDFPPQPRRFLRIARSGFGKAEEEWRRGIAGREFGRPREGEARRGTERAAMIGQRIAEPDPQLVVAGMPRDLGLEQLRRVLRCCRARPAHRPC